MLGGLGVTALGLGLCGGTGHAWKGGIRLWKTEISPESAECWTRVCNRTPGLEVDSAHACRAPRPGRGHQVPFLLDDISLVE